jgi:APA family basic amino acid/polyamine antiporter
VGVRIAKPDLSWDARAVTIVRDHKLGIWMTGALVVGSMIGSGIFMLPVSLAPLGANAVLGWVVSILGALAIAFSLASLSRTGEGGIRAYIERAFGPAPAFLVAWALFWSNIAAQAALAIATASAASSLFPALGGASGIVAVGVGSVILLTLVNLRGVRTSGALSLLTVVIKILPLLAVVAFLATRQISGVPFERLASSPLTLANIATATALTLFALTGFENATAPVDKVRDPARTIPRAILGGAALVGLIYLVSSSGVMLLLPADRIATSPAPYADVIALKWGHHAASLAALAIAISAFGALNSLMFGTGELGYAMGLRGDLPPVIARTGHDNIPYVAHVISGAMTIVLILANSSKATASLFTFVILLSTAAVLVVYAVGALAAWQENASPVSRVIFGVALLFILFAAYGAGMEGDLWCLALLAVGLPIRVISRWLSDSIPAAETSPAAPLE